MILTRNFSEFLRNFEREKNVNAAVYNHCAQRRYIQVSTLMLNGGHHIARNHIFVLATRVIGKERLSTAAYPFAPSKVHMSDWRVVLERLFTTSNEVGLSSGRAQGFLPGVDTRAMRYSSTVLVGVYSSMINRGKPWAHTRGDRALTLLLPTFLCSTLPLIASPFS